MGLIPNNEMTAVTLCLIQMNHTVYVLIKGNNLILK